MQLHILTANGSVTDTKTGMTVGNLVDYDIEETTLTVVSTSEVIVFYVTSLGDVQRHGMVVEADLARRNTFGDFAADLIDANIEGTAPSDLAHHNH